MQEMSFDFFEDDAKEGTLLVVVEDVEQYHSCCEWLRGALKTDAIKASGFGDRKSQYLYDIFFLSRGKDFLFIYFNFVAFINA